MAKVRTEAQTLPVGSSVAEEAIRFGQLDGSINTQPSLMLRPLSLTEVLTQDSLSPELRSLLKGFASNSIRPSQKKIHLLPITIRQQFNSHHSYGYNDGSVIPAKGFQTQISAGVSARFGPVSIQFRPEFVWAQNAGFPAFPPGHSDHVWQNYYDTVLNKIDAPFRFGEGRYAKAFPGQSSIRFHFKKLSIGLSTENLWWGPGVRNALLMTNNAPGFPHLTLNTTAPVVTPIGSFEGQLVGGLLKKSGFLPPDTGRTVDGRRLFVPKLGGDRYLNGLVLTWQPKWTKGFYLGFSRASYTYVSFIKPSFNGYLPVISGFFKGSGSSIDREDAKRTDQMLSFFFRLLLPKEGFELYGELGRNDHSGNVRDLLLEPEHSRATVVGLKKLIQTHGKTKMEIMAEFTNLQLPLTRLVREQESWYSHYQVRDGYTHLGQVIGAGIGSGGSSQTLGANWWKGINRTGVLLERVVHNNDFYYNTFASLRDYSSHWVDYSLHLHRSWRRQHFLYDARLSLVKSLNYQWQNGKDVHHLNAALSVSYLF